MRIAFLSTFHPFRGGIAQFNARLFRELETQQHQLKAFNFSTQYPEKLFPGKSQYVSSDDPADPIPNERLLSSINPLSYLQAGKAIKKFEPNLLLMRYWMPFFAPSLGTAAWQLNKRNCKRIAILDNLVPHEQRLGDTVLNKYFLSQTDAYVVMSRAVEKDLNRLKPNANYIFHPHPVYNQFAPQKSSEEARKTLNIPKGKKVLLFFGLIRQYKGLDLLLEAFRELPEDYFLVIAGEPYESMAAYQALMEKEAHRILAHTHYISDDLVPDYFSAADVLVLPYRSATQSGVTAVAYHFNLPVISTDVGGLRETLEPYNAGLIVAKPDSRMIVDAIREYFDKKMKDTMSKNMQTFKERYSWESLANNILDLYHRLKTNQRKLE